MSKTLFDDGQSATLRDRSRLLPGAVLAAVFVGMMSAPAAATVIPFTASLDGAQEVPPVTTTGRGTAQVQLDDATNLLSWDLSFSDLTGPATQAHFHGPAPIGVVAPVQVDIGAISGLSSPLVGTTTITATQSSDLLAGLWYLNVHTAQYPAGEIRGQVLPTGQGGGAVPEPGTLALLLGAGLAGLGLARRRQPAAASLPAAA